MKTDELINLLKEDAPVGPGLRQRLLAMVLAGGLVSALFLLATIGLRPDLLDRMQTPSVAFKIVETVLLATIGILLALQAGRPEVDLAGRFKLLALPVLLLVLAVLIEASAAPAAEWGSRWIGNHPVFCLFFIPVLSVAPLTALLIALREGAPQHAGLAGATAGLAAGAMAAAIYAWHCPDDSPFFVATWYMLAILAVTGIGYRLGQRLLRW